MNAATFDARPNTCARMANRTEKKVDATAANCGDFPKGAPTKNDQLAKDNLTK